MRDTGKALYEELKQTEGGVDAQQRDSYYIRNTDVAEILSRERALSGLARQEEAKQPSLTLKVGPGGEISPPGVLCPWRWYHGRNLLSQKSYKYQIIKKLSATDFRAK